jgi:hypothetical protein
MEFREIIARFWAIDPLPEKSSVRKICALRLSASLIRLSQSLKPFLKQELVLALEVVKVS